MAIALGGLLASAAPVRAAGDTKYAHSDSDSRYLHHIHLYDTNNRRITADSTTPYSSVNTCGRCHDYDTIAHGWHFNAFLPESDDGRQGEPWVWTDARTGTQLPLSYRDWPQTYDPRKIGIDQWMLTRKFGGRLPGGGVGVAPEEAEAPSQPQGDEPSDDAENEDSSETPVSRWPLTGSLEIDCLVCHSVSGKYDFNARREQIAAENFSWAATAALRIGTVDGEVSRIKDGADPDDEATQEKLPKVAYDQSVFASDGTVFVDLVRQPQNNACYQCHSNRTVNEQGIESRWTHDEDVHLRAGMQCVDCHRNGIDHHIVRGFPGEKRPDGQSMVTLSCAGCHLGSEFVEQLSTEVNLAANGKSAAADAEPADTKRADPELADPELADPELADTELADTELADTELADTEQADAGQNEQVEKERGTAPTREVTEIRSLAGRLGSPRPAHAGLPPVHFEKLSCTACHAGPLPRDQALGIMTSLAHSLGEKEHRSGQELPRILGPVYAKQPDGRIYPHRVMWPAFWAVIQDDTLRPLDPESVYDITRRSLRVRNDFQTEIVMPELRSSELKELIGEDRYRVDPQEWTDEETQKVQAARQAAGQELFQEKVAAALAAIQEELGVERAAYVSSGTVYATSADGEGIQKLEVQDPQATGMIRWPIAHRVRPAGWSLGITGCTECHSDSATLFTSTVAATGPGPEDGPPTAMAVLQGIDADQRLAWNQLFSGRATFKYAIAASLVVLAAVLLLGIGLLMGRRRSAGD
ncbi:hypothetical protein FYK55_06175 [Roseiconus nitratireducens]|uniref:Cytochrome c-552/4 domain-containing protein n=1 Tax=Roseiconus nitratireducens TaxID=2605748 RepID=A0A5M6DCG0_9BACT|nr:multiheme c-type cytochrome [Roseiconus nitratireducens]KAA5545248.1 hypothetical protein FYK55_06175 [Roseiconus nitratireducens]